MATKSPAGISPDQACYARARAWAFVFRCWREKQGAIDHASESDDHSKHEVVAKRRGGRRDLISNASSDTEDIRTEQSGKEKRVFHR
jgi:hypothetical protein